MSQVVPNTISIATPLKSRRRFAFLRLIYRSPIALVSACWIVLLTLACAAAPILPLQDPLLQNLTQALQMPSGDHWLGTDSLGRDVLSRILWGGQGALLGALEAVVVAIAIGAVLGVVAGYMGGWVNALATRFAELIFALPAMIVLLALAAVLGSNIVASMASFGVLVSASYLRLAQASTLAVRNELYVDAAKVAGLSTPRVIFGHVLPNVAGPIIIMSSLTFGAALLVQAALGFLGLGPPPPAPNWGAMISEASSNIYGQPWLLVPTGVVLALTILAANLIGDTLRDGDGARQRFSMLKRASSTARKETARDAGSDVLLSVQDLQVSFGDTTVVDGVSFDVRRGEVLAVVGESGSGKTMTALATIGLLPFPGRVAAGRILFGGDDLTAMSESERAKYRGRRVGMISQEPMSALDPCFTVASQLIGPVRRHRRLSKSRARAVAESLLADVGLPDVSAVMKSYPHQLSGGMAQRVAIAIALAGEPELLIADEPTTALDVTVQAGILDLIRSLQERLGMTVVFVTHDLGVVADIAARAVVMERGRIVEEADIFDLFAAPQHEYTRALLRSTPSLVDLEAPRA